MVMNDNKVSIVIVGLTALAISLLGSVPVGAAQIGSIDVKLSDLPIAERQDLEKVAAQEGISINEALKKYGWQSSATVELEDFEVAVGDNLTYTVFTDAGVEIGFKNSAPESAIQALESSLNVKIQVNEGLGYSADEMVSAGEEIHYLVIDAVGNSQIATDIDVLSGEITVSSAEGVAESSAFEPAEEAVPPEDIIKVIKSHQEISDIINSLPDEVTISVGQVTEEGGTEVARGGGHLTSCTAAWSVSKSGYSKGGLMTAAHCPDTQKYQGRGILNYRGQMAKAKGDAQWHSSTEVTTNTFYYTAGATRKVTSVKSPVLGQQLCVYGKTTRNTCDKVYKLNQCSGGYCGMVATHRHHTKSGDSGGPWFWGNTAYGVHHGYKTIFPFERSLFTPAKSAETGLGVKIKTR